MINPPHEYLETLGLTIIIFHWDVINTEREREREREREFEV